MTSWGTEEDDEEAVDDRHGLDLDLQAGMIERLSAWDGTRFYRFTYNKTRILR